MLLTADLMAWGVANGAPAPISMDTFPSDEVNGGAPHRVYVFRISGGLGTETEGALDAPTVTVLTRGVNGRDAETLAYQMDSMLLDGPSMFDVGDYPALGVYRFGGPPSYVSTDDRARVVRAATYGLRIGR